MILVEFNIPIPAGILLLQLTESSEDRLYIPSELFDEFFRLLSRCVDHIGDLLRFENMIREASTEYVGQVCTSEIPGGRVFGNQEYVPQQEFEEDDCVQSPLP